LKQGYHSGPASITDKKQFYRNSNSDIDGDRLYANRGDEVSDREVRKEVDSYRLQPFESGDVQKKFSRGMNNEVSCASCAP